MTIIAAIDQSERTEDVIKEADLLASVFGDELHIAHVLTESETADIERANVRRTGKAKGRGSIADLAAEIVSDTVEDYTIEDYTPVGLIGNPAERIQDYAQKQDARYIVVGGRKRSPVGKAVFGSVAQSILLNADRPVVATKRG